MSGRGRTSEDVWDWMRRQSEVVRGLWQPSAVGSTWLWLFGALGIVGFILSAVVLSATLTDRDNVDKLEDFSKRILTDYLTHKCVRCTPAESLLYATNITDVIPEPVQMHLTGAALQQDQFVTGLVTPCGACVNAGGYSWTAGATRVTVADGLRGEMLGFVRGVPYALSEYGVTYDPLGIWGKALGIEIDETKADDRCDGKHASSMYVVAISSDLIQEVCCKYVICMCTIPGPREFCTRPLLLASDPADADRLNCLDGNLPGGCGCGMDVC